MTQVSPNNIAGEWEKRGYRVVPTSLDDLDLDYLDRQKAEKEEAYVLEIRADEAKLFIDFQIQEAIAGESLKRLELLREVKKALMMRPITDNQGKIDAKDVADILNEFMDSLTK